MQPYHEDPTVREFTTKIKRIIDKKYVLLEKSYFYPVGGGQPHDTGTLSIGGQVYPILFVEKKDDSVYHEVALPEDHLLQEGIEVHCSINDLRRKKHTRAHTAAHIICAVIEQDTGALITGNQLGEDEIRIDFSLENYTPKIFEAIIEKANTLINKHLSVSSNYIQREEMIGEMTHLAKGFPAHIKDVRVLTIQDVDLQACGGTHVENTAEIGRIEIIKFKNKGAKNRRIYCKIVA